MTSFTLFAGLRGRVAGLAALIALLATIACAMLAAQALVAGMRSQRESAAAAVADQARHRLNRLVQRLTFEATDYAVWDELHQRMPLPDEAWSRLNLAPGSSSGRLTQAFALIAAGSVTGRYRRSSMHELAPSRDDPLPVATLVAMARPEAHAGIAVSGGFPTLFAAIPVLPSDGSGPSRGTLVALAYLTSAIHGELLQPGFELELAPIPRPMADTRIAWRDGQVAATIAVPTHDGQGLAMTVVEVRAADDQLVRRAVMAMAAAGAASAALAIIIGIAVGWSWMRPFTALAAACRRRVADPAAPLPPAGGLHEAEVLREALDRLTVAERANADRLGEALDRERTVNAVHQRFLAQLGHEIGDPLHALVATMQRLAAEGGRLPPEEVAVNLERALELESRLQEALGLVGPEFSAARSEGGVREIASYLAGVVELLRPLAASRGGSVTVSGSGRVALSPQLLTPILINLASNALRARRGVQVTISGEALATVSRWQVADDGPGMAEDLAARIADACTRGEVLPGSAGIGLGLAVVFANLRALGGSISLDNRPDQGVHFTIELPLIRR